MIAAIRSGSEGGRLPGLLLVALPVALLIWLVLWPVLTESIAYAAAADGALPRWLNRVLDVASLCAPLLVEAARRGWIPAEAAALPGLADIAGRPGKSAAVVKARELLGVVRRG